MASKNYGATPEEWDHFDLILGIGPDLLPVVSNPDAKVSADSKIQGIGKTPSRYNGAGEVVGIAGWTSHQASDKDIARWSRQPDYGICLQTRTVRALDIDVDDTNLVADILGEVFAHRYMPTRRRPNSAKCLLAFTLPGELGKRKMVVDGGIIEFLATGQQFIALGTHPSGARYEWVNDLPAEFPELTLDEFETIWSALAARFATGGVSTGSVSVRKKGDHVALPDPVGDYLREQGLVIAEDRDGALVIPCPWESEHTTGSKGDGSTVWFPAGTNGYDMGHFKCLHGHCDGRGDADYFNMIGYAEDVSGEFDVVAVKAGASEPLPLPKFKRDKYGRIEAVIENVALACRRPDICGMDIRFDRFRDEIMFSAPGRAEWQQFTDQDYSRLRITLERGGFRPIGRELVRDVVLLVATDNPFDSAQEWITGLEWDGVPRVERFLTDYFGASDDDYIRSVSRYLWTALAGRVVSPGIKADMVPILVGAQGTGKSSAVAAIAPAHEFFTEVSFHEKEDDLSRKMRGRLIGEIGELRGLHTKELESIKAFITRTHENWVPKFREFAVQFPRRMVFIGTTNKDEFLADETGNRRWLPVRVDQVNVDQIEQDRGQLWAEGKVLFDRMGIDFREAEGLAEAVHEDHRMIDLWEDVVGKWLDEPDALTGEVPRARYFLRATDVLRGALRMDDKHIGRREEMRIGGVLRNLGYERKKVSDEGVKKWAFVGSGTY